MCMCTAFQVGLIILLFAEFFAPENISAFNQPVPSVSIIIARVICVFILHISLQDELIAGMELMKFAINSPTQFEPNCYWISYLAGLAQGSVVIGVEILSVTVCLTSTMVLDIVMNFIALAIIADFDDFIYGSIRNESIKNVIEDEEKLNEANILTIRVTTSSNANEDEPLWELPQEAAEPEEAEEEEAKDDKDEN